MLFLWRYLPSVYKHHLLMCSQTSIPSPGGIRGRGVLPTHMLSYITCKCKNHPASRLTGDYLCTLLFIFRTCTGCPCPMWVVGSCPNRANMAWAVSDTSLFRDGLSCSYIKRVRKQRGLASQGMLPMPRPAAASACYLCLSYCRILLL